ncbi:WD40 repeat-like protein [Fomitiporia mediterranea MF3/22]|uniref:WD40 repeat-like protein n=1 Tax=Fomitiporia mediterranea (strain MF3/22) TaxID=694068 RepID=UPI00044078A2|nr:WD40 repeat-like protein [Fomitiporia mediterranea MF3/22]EJD02482.1 WD40 repeat-like protein [Fomitiporia mediterranea MF3/22]
MHDICVYAHVSENAETAVLTVNHLKDIKTQSSPLHIRQTGTCCSTVTKTTSILLRVPRTDGPGISSLSSDKTVRIWDAQTGAQVFAPLQGQQGDVWSVAYSPDERYSVSGSSGKTVCIWDTQKDGRYIASGSDDATVQIWDAQTGAQVGAPLEGHQDSVQSVAYSPDGRHIVSGSDDKTLRIWDAQTRVQLGRPLEGHQGWVRCVAYSLDGCHVISGSSDKTIRVWDAQTGAHVGPQLDGHQWWVFSFAFYLGRYYVVLSLVDQDGIDKYSTVRELSVNCGSGRMDSDSDRWSDTVDSA